MKDNIKSIDSLKGILILLMIIGHVLTGSYYENIYRYIIYGFHMPLFFVTSGYLLNTNTVSSLNIKDLIQKYLFRIIVPWMVALLSYYILLHLTHQHERLIYYHLWYIPSFLLSVALFWLFSKLNLPIKYVLLIAIFIFFLFYKPVTSKPAIIFYDIRPYHFVFFIFGIFFKRYASKFNMPITCTLLIISFIVYMVIRAYPDTELRAPIFLLLNLSLATLIFFNIKKLPNTQFLDWIGRNSLAIYLWHVLPLIIIKRYVTDSSIYYLSSFLFILLLFFIIHLLNKIPFIRHYCFGLNYRPISDKKV